MAVCGQACVCGHVPVRGFWVGDDQRAGRGSNVWWCRRFGQPRGFGQRPRRCAQTCGAAQRCTRTRQISLQMPILLSSCMTHTRPACILHLACLCADPANLDQAPPSAHRHTTSSTASQQLPTSMLMPTNNQDVLDTTSAGQGANCQVMHSHPPGS